MGLFLKRAMIGTVAFGAPMGLLYTLMAGNAVGFAFGLAAGLLFGVLMAAFAAAQQAHFSAANPCVGDERLLRQGPANLFRGWEGVGGWLYLTDRRLVFRSHRFNVQKGEWSVLLQDIAEVRPYLISGFMPTGLRVEAPDGAKSFVVQNRSDWVRAIQAAQES